MRASLALLFGAVLSVLAHEGHDAPAADADTTDAPVVHSDVVQMTKDSFDEFIKKHDLVLAEFFAPWCGHCKALAPEYEEAATALRVKDIVLIKVDCTEETDLCATYGVEGYPTLKIFRGLDAVTPYGGPRKADAIVSYMVKQALPAVSILDKASLEEFKTADKVVLVGYYAEDDKSSDEVYHAMAEKHRDDYVFGFVSDASVAKAEGVKQPAIVLYKSFDEGKNTYTEKFDIEAIEKFASVAATPLVGEVGPVTYQGYMMSGLPLAYIFAETPEEREEFAKELKPVAEKHKGVVNIATIDAKAFGQHGSNLNLEVGKWPAFAIHETQKNEKYPFDQSKAITAKDIGAFVDDFVAGKLTPSIKSEPIPETQEGVYVVVADSYKEAVINNDKDVLLEFYAPWCGHCKALAPKYELLAELYKEHTNVVIAKIDATANDVPDAIQGFPTIKLFPAGKKDEPITFEGGRTTAELAAFIAESGTYKIAVEVPPEPEPEEEEPVQAAPAATEEAAEETKEEAAEEAAAANSTHDEL